MGEKRWSKKERNEEEAMDGNRKLKTSFLHHYFLGLTYR